MLGGVETQSITEMYGEFDAGKSQVTKRIVRLVDAPNLPDSEP